jgi:hypothetical protein
MGVCLIWPRKSIFNNMFQKPLCWEKLIVKGNDCENMTPPIMKNIILMQSPMKFCVKLYNLVHYIRFNKGAMKARNGWA